MKEDFFPVLDAELVNEISAVRLVAFDFDGVFTDNLVLVNEDGSESVRCSRSDGLGLRKLDEAGVAYCIVSTETNPVVARRAEKLGADCYHGCADKLATLNELLAQHALAPEQAMYVGNDINDLPCLTSGVLSVAVSDAYPEVLDVARYRTRRPGGYGAVREICDLVYRIKTCG
ncbi:MAG TPA: 3-deoxy-D-manno-octulosonate 8-phosphate phosphatase [Acidiferrobacteraceae bacterium]|nr:3-deoxy-D-manno-octulosonate 8-phosphate phosphatase [Acidiferrobacteraceae bacterium]